eukprot:3190784-Prymnesium_polylepis.2
MRTVRRAENTSRAGVRRARVCKARGRAKCLARSWSSARCPCCPAPRTPTAAAPAPARGWESTGVWQRWVRWTVEARQG